MIYNVDCLDRYSENMRIVTLQVVVSGDDVDEEIQDRVPSRFLPLTWIKK